MSLVYPGDAISFSPKEQIVALVKELRQNTHLDKRYVPAR